MTKDTQISRSEFSMRDLVYIILSSVVILFFMAASASPWPMHKTFVFLTIFELVMVILYARRDRFLLSLHLQYQAIAISIPGFLMFSSAYNLFYPSDVTAFLDSFHFVKVKEFVQQCPILCTNLFGAWTCRLVLTYLNLIDVNTEHRLDESKTNDLGPIRQSFCHKILNLVAFYFFFVMAYTLGSSKIALFLTMLEIVMAMSYDLMHPNVILVHYIFQSVFFTFPLFVNWLSLVKNYNPAAAFSILESYGLESIRLFIHSPLIVSCVITLVWLLRMLASQVFLIEVATDRRIASRQLQLKPLKLIDFV